jgi:hypothetical protein
MRTALDRPSRYRLAAVLQSLDAVCSLETVRSARA